MSSSAPAPSALTAALLATAARRGPAPAIRGADRSLSIGELADRVAAFAGRLAEELTSVPGGPAPWTPLLVDWTPNTIVAVHGLVWAGRRFALIDPGAPAARIAELFARLGDPTVAVVASPELRGVLPPGVRAVPVDDRGGTAIEPRPVIADEPGLVVFTSGSTGRPKGVLKAWRSFERALNTQLTMWPDGLASRPDHGHLRPLHFNGAVNVSALTALGCRVELIDPKQTDLDGLLDRIHASGVTSIGPGPALAEALVRAAGGARRLPAVRSVNLGGAASRWELVAGLRTLVAPEARIRAGYGATESGNVMSYRVDPDAPVLEGAVPLGRPVDPTRIRLVPVESGSDVCQMWIRDPDAVGYLGEAELSAARFPIDDVGRWWVSGDVATIDADGVFHHRGRVDDLAKINGMLVEPSEAEHALRAVPGISAAAVLVVSAPAGAHQPSRLRLVAHLCVDDPALTARAVRERLLTMLPAPLVPSVFVRHDHLPLTVNNKVDRQALKAMAVEPWGAAPPRWPADEGERAITGLCRELLEQVDLGPDDDLWLMGLDSLGAVELCAMVADEGLGDLDPRVLLERFTPAEVAHHLRTRRVSGGERDSDLAILNAEGTRPPVFGMPGAGQTALAMVSLARALGADQPVVVAEPYGMHTRGRPDRSVEAVAARARLEIDAYLGDRAADEIVVFGHSAGATTAYELAQQRSRAGQRTRLVLIDGVPRAAGRPADAPPIPDRVNSWEPVNTPRLKGRLRELPAIALRQAAIIRYELFPGRPQARPLRYLAFYRRFGRLAQRYGAQPARFPCIVVQVAGSNAAAKARELIADIEVRHVGGDHRSCMDHPHVVDVAAAIRDAQAAAVSRR